MDQACWLLVQKYKKYAKKKGTWKSLWLLEDPGIFQFSKLYLIWSSAEKKLWEHECYNGGMPTLHQQGKQNLDLKLLEILFFFSEVKSRGKITRGKRAGCNWLGNDYSRTPAVQQIIRMCQWHPVVAAKSSEGQVSEFCPN